MKHALLFTTIFLVACTRTQTPYNTALLGKGITEFDPTAVSEINETTLISQICGRITAIDDGLNIEGDLSKRWTVSEDQKTYIFQLDKTRRFANGDPLTPEDVVFSLARASKSGSVVKAWLDEVKAISIVDNNSFKIELKAGNPRFLYKLSHPRACILHRTKPFISIDNVSVPNSSAPYVISAAKDGEISLVKSKFYNGEVVEPLIRVRFLDEKSAVQEFKQGRLDDLSFYLLNYETLRNLPSGTHFLKAKYFWSWAIWLNPKSTLFKNKRNRLGVLNALDIEELIKIWNSNVDSSRSMVPKGMRGYFEDQATAKSNPIALKCGTPIKVTAIEGMPQEQDLKTGLKKTIGTATGCDVQVDFLEMGSFIKNYVEGNSDIYVGGIDPNSTDPLNYYRRFIADDPENNLGYNDPELSKAYNDGIDLPIESRQMSQYIALQRAFVASGFGIVIGHPTFEFAYGEKVTAVHMNPLGMHLNRWSKIGRK